MPVIKVSTYAPNPLMFNGHIETIYPAVLRKIKRLHGIRQRIETPDGDFLDLDRYLQCSKHAIIISHGLEGNSTRPYILGMVKRFYGGGFDVIAWNFRGCSGEINRQKIFYHSGATYDLETVIQHSIDSGYEKIFLIGFSLGGNLTLKYLGENGDHVPQQIKGAVTFSVPLELHTSCIQISKRENKIYANRFLKNLKRKVRLKAKKYQDLNVDLLQEIHTLAEFDDQYTAPLHGFDNAIDYYSKCSALQFLKHISRPALIVNALNDPFLSPECYPEKLLHDHPLVFFESPQHGGHVGFPSFNGSVFYWSEDRAFEFVKELLEQ